MEIILTGNPQSTNNIYRHTGHRVYMTQKGRTLKEDYQWQCKQQYKGKPKTGNLDVRVELFFGDIRKRDIDNYGKLLWDSMSGIIYEDDSQIQSMLVLKNYDKKNPRIEVEITENN